MNSLDWFHKYAVLQFLYPLISLKAMQEELTRRNYISYVFLPALCLK